MFIFLTVSWYRQGSTLKASLWRSLYAGAHRDLPDACVTQAHGYPAAGPSLPASSSTKGRKPVLSIWTPSSCSTKCNQQGLRGQNTTCAAPSQCPCIHKLSEFAIHIWQGEILQKSSIKGSFRQMTMIWFFFLIPYTCSYMKVGQGYFRKKTQHQRQYCLLLTPKNEIMI